MKAKAISLWQPWASFVALGYKKWETRSWSTDYRGPLVIHAARRKASISDLSRPAQHFFYRIFDQILDYHYGHALCVVNLAGVYPVEVVRDDLSDMERAFGDCSDGRFAWELDDLRLFEPVPIRGRQGLWNVTLDPVWVVEQSEGESK